MATSGCLAGLFLLCFVVYQAGVTAFEPKYITTHAFDTRNLLLRRKFFVYRDAAYTNWSTWGNCSVADCTEFRFRKCIDDSWEEQIYSLLTTKKCPFQFVVESRKCTNESLCEMNIKSKMLEEFADTCGIRTTAKKAVETKIMGGKHSIPHSWPWQVGLYVKASSSHMDVIGRRKRRRSNPQVPFCGGTLIAPDWLVTAAHCLTELAPDRHLPVGKPFELSEKVSFSIFARVGDHRRDELEAQQHDVEVQHVVIHPNYNSDLSEDGYDIVLMKLTKPLNQSAEVDWICVPNVNISLELGSKCYAAGWGETSSSSRFDGPDSWIFDFFPSYGPHFARDSSFFNRRRARPKQALALTEVELPIVSLQKCKRYFPNLQEGVHVCAGQKGRDTCRGDSGGGLFCKNPVDDRWYVYGVTSFGSSRGCGKHYGVYTCVRGVAGWIHRQLA